MALDCGHEPSPHSEFTTGTAHTPDGKEICWTCSDQIIREEIREAAPKTLLPCLYLTKDGNVPVLSTWNGTPMMRVEELWTKQVGFGWRNGRTYFRAVDAGTGTRFYGTSPGFGQYARVYKSKVQL